MTTPHAPLRLRRATSAAVWDGLAQRLPGGTPFHRWDFLDLQERALGLRFERLLIESAGVPAGVLPLARPTARSPRTAPLPFPLLGPAVDPVLLVPLLRAVRRRQVTTGLLLARFDVGPDLVPALERVLPARGLTTIPDGTVQVDLKAGSEEQLVAAMHRTRRKRLRQSQRAGVRVRPAKSGETTRLLPEALREAYARRDAVDPYPEGTARHIEAWAAGRSDVRLAVAEVNGRPVGELVTLSAGDQGIAWVGAALPAGRTAYAETALLVDALTWSAARGCTRFEFAGRVDDDVEFYKVSFGGQPRPYATLESLLGPSALVRGVRRLRGR